ncbi:MAG TPA: XkdX family protein [Candidatus Fimivivens faecavium]|nr:XkdX family protein [Candidatus Fimivivens faecavium]
MSNKEMAERNYTKGMWTDSMLCTLTAKGKLTAEEYEEITGSKYPGKAAE